MQLFFRRVLKIVLFIIIFLLGFFVAAPLLSSAYAKAETKCQQYKAKIFAYTSSREETDSTPTITANGEVAGPGSLACPRRYHFGTKVLIGNSLYTCNDRMNIRYKNEFDIWVATKKEVFNWGVCFVIVIIYVK